MIYLCTKTIYLSPYLDVFIWVLVKILNFFSGQFYFNKNTIWRDLCCDQIYSNFFINQFFHAIIFMDKQLFSGRNRNSRYFSTILNTKKKHFYNCSTEKFQNMKLTCYYTDALILCSMAIVFSAVTTLNRKSEQSTLVLSIYISFNISWRFIRGGLTNNYYFHYYIYDIILCFYHEFSLI